MIRLVQKGGYNLVETKKHTQMLILDRKQAFAWIHAGEIGEILVTSHTPLTTDRILSSGKYRLYSVKDEPDFTDLMHLELLTGVNTWQGYLLPNGLPTDEAKRHRIIVTNEVITQSSL